MSIFRKFWRVGLVTLLFLGAWHSAANAQTGTVIVLTLDGPLTPAFSDYVQRGMAQAERENVELVILQLNTPGGQIDLMDNIVATLRNSRVPVVVFVSPRGAQAASAGTVITLAGRASAMAPETVIGAASPVGSQGEDLGSTIESKLKEDLKAKVRALAAYRPPEAIALAEATIESAKAATAAEAHAVGMIDFLAADVPDLLRQLDGFTVEMNGSTRLLRTQGLAVRELPMNLLETVLNLLTNPNIVYLLLTAGGALWMLELSAPGGWVAGFLGTVCLALAFYGLGVLPVNWFGIVFIIVAFVLFVIDVYATAHGTLTAAGAGSLIVGALVLFNSAITPDYFRVNVPLVVGTALVIAAGVVVLLIFGLRAQLRPVVTGVESLIGQEGEARSANSVQVAGELWSAEREGGALEAGQKVVVTAIKGLRLIVRKQ